MATASTSTISDDTVKITDNNNDNTSNTTSVISTGTTPELYHHSAKLFGNSTSKDRWLEFHRLNQVAFPVILTYVLTYTQQIINSMLVGHIGPTELAASALGMYISKHY